MARMKKISEKTGAKNKAGTKPKTKKGNVQRLPSLDPAQVVKFLVNESNFPSPLRLTAKVLEKWLRAMDTGASNQARKDVTVAVHSGLQAASDPPVTRQQCEDFIRRHGVSETDPVLVNSWSEFIASHSGSDDLEEDCAEEIGAGKPKVKKPEVRLRHCHQQQSVFPKTAPSVASPLRSKASVNPQDRKTLQQLAIDEFNRKFLNRAKEARAKHIFRRFSGAGLDVKKQWAKESVYCTTMRSFCLNGEEMAYWSIMANVADSFANDNIPAARVSFALATVILERWEKLAGEAPECSGAGVPYKTSTGDQRFKTPLLQQMLRPPRDKSRKFDVLSPQYKFEARVPRLETIIDPGHRMHRTPGSAEVDAHAQFKRYALRSILKLMKTSPRGGAVVRTVPLTWPKLVTQGLARPPRPFNPVAGKFVKLREVEDVLASQHEARSIHLSQARTNDRLVCVVRYSSTTTRSLSADANHVRDILVGLHESFPDVQFSPHKQTVMIRGYNTRSSLTPSLWHDIDQEIKVSRYGFVFQDYGNKKVLDRKMRTQAVAELFTRHLSGQFELAKELKLSLALFLVGHDSLGSSRERIVAYVKDVHESTGQGFNIFINAL
ncbi:hypothetical protein KCU95_g11701, partial [Aureobasidium melanogenum]